MINLNFSECNIGSMSALGRTLNQENLLPASGYTTSIFRKQAMEHQRACNYGAVVLSQPASYSILTITFVIIAASIVAFFICFSTTRKVHSEGILTPYDGVIRVLAGQGGVISETRVLEGQRVGAGEVLFVLTNDTSSSLGDTSEIQVSSLLKRRRDSFNDEKRQAEQQSALRLASLNQRIESLVGEISRIRSQIKLQERRVNLAEANFARYSELQATQFISAALLQEKEAEVLDQQQRLAELRRIYSLTERERVSAQHSGDELRLQAQRDLRSLDRNISILEQDLTENETRHKIFVRAAKSGIVSTVGIAVGQRVHPNNLMASIVPDESKLEAEIFVPSSSVGFIKPGMPVLLRYQAYPYQKFGQYRAIVRVVANTAIRADELLASGTTFVPRQSREPIFRVRLRLEKSTVRAYGEELSLKPGMLVDASIILEHRRLYEWVTEPLFSISGRRG